MAKSKADYVIDLITEARRERVTTAGEKRAARALVEIGLSGTDLLQTGAYMELWKSDGLPYTGKGMSWSEAQRMADKKRDQTGRLPRRAARV